MPRVTFQPSDKERAEVEAMSGYGVPHESIATIIGIAPKTLRRAFRAELDKGMAKANAKIGQTLFQMAIGTSERAPDTRALIYWTKARMGWRETEKPDVENPGGITVTIRGGFTDA